MAFDDHYRLSSHAVITDNNGEILQIKATYGARGWGLPGGSLDNAETFHDALQRECLEELGQPVRILYMSGIYYHKAFNSHAAIFRCEFINDAPTITLSHEHDDKHFFPFDELSPVQQIRVRDCLEYDGVVKAASF